MTSTIKETAKLTQGEIDEEWLDHIFTNFERDAFDLTDIENNNRLILSSYSGNYSYNSTTNGWDVEENNSAIIISFPCTSTDSGNSLQFEITKYSDKLYTIDGEQYGIPSELSLSISKNNTTLLSFNINSLDFTQDDDLIIPTTINATLYINPITTELKLSSSNSGKTFDASVSLYDNNGFSTSLSGNLNLLHNSYTLLEDEDIDDVTLSLSVNETKITGTADVNTIIALDELTQSQFNSLINVDILSNEQKIADVEFDINYETIELLYKDGSTEAIDENYLQDFVDKVEVEVVNELGQLD